MASLSSINIRIGANLKDFSTKLQNAERKLSRFGKNMAKVGKNMTMKLSLPLAAVAGLAVKTFASFEQQMAKVKAVSGATAKEFEMLEANAKELGRTTRFTASEVATLELNYSKLGFSANEIDKVTKSTLDLALATGEDLAESATVAASTLRGFELDASEMQMVVDVMAKSFSASALDLEKFKTAMATVAPVAKNANVSLQETTAQLATLVNRGVDASTAGTSLRNIFLTLAKEGLSFNDAMDKISNSTNKNATALALFGKRGATAAIILAKNREETAGLTDEFIDSTGAASGMAEIMDDTLQGSLLSVKSAVEGIAITIGSHLAPSVKALGERLKNLSARFQSMSTQQQRMTLGFGKMAIALGPAIFLVGKLAIVLPKLAIAIKAVGRAMKFVMANPLMIVVGLLVAAAAALVVYKKRALEAASETRELGDELKDVNKELGKQVFLQIAREGKKAGDIFKEDAEIVEFLRENLNQLSVGELQALAMVLEDKVVQAQNAVNASVKDGEISQRAAQGELNNYTEALKIISTELGTYDDAVDKATGGSEDLGNEIEGTTKKIVEQTKALFAYQQATAVGATMSKDAWEEAGVKIGESELATLALNKAVEGITPKLVQVGKVGVESVKALGGTVEDTTEKVGTLAQRIAESFQVYGDLAKRAIDIVAQAFDAQKTKAIKLIETERDASIKAAGDNASKKEQIEQQAADKINAINEEFAKKQKKLSIAMAIINVAQGITKAIGQGGVLGLITGVLVAAAGAAQIATIQAQGFAMGTNFAPGGLAMVGERGPELVNLPRGSKVTPNHKLGGLQMVQVYGNIAGSSIRISNDRSNQRSDRII